MILHANDPIALYCIAVLEGTKETLPLVTYVDEEKQEYHQVVHLRSDTMPPDDKRGTWTEGSNLSIGLHWFLMKDGKAVTEVHHGPVKLYVHRPDRFTLDMFQSEIGRFALFGHTITTPERIMHELEESIPTLA